MSYIKSIQKLLLEDTEDYDSDHHQDLHSELQHSAMQYHKLNRLHQNAPDSYKTHLEHAKNAALDILAKDHANVIHYHNSHKSDPDYISSDINPKLLDYINSTQEVHDDASAEYDRHYEDNIEGL